MELATALAATNTAVIKPSEFTSVSTLEFMELIKEVIKEFLQTKWVWIATKTSKDNFFIMKKIIFTIRWLIKVIFYMYYVWIISEYL